MECLFFIFSTTNTKEVELLNHLAILCLELGETNRFPYSHPIIFPVEVFKVLMALIPPTPSVSLI